MSILQLQEVAVNEKRIYNIAASFGYVGNIAKVHVLVVYVLVIVTTVVVKKVIVPWLLNNETVTYGAITSQFSYL